MQVFEYGANEIAHLKSRDKLLGAAIDRIGVIRREVNPDPFTALISSVISQQISKRAAETVCSRLYALLRDVTHNTKGRFCVFPSFMIYKIITSL